MSVNDIELVLKFIGGLGMFLYGMNVMSDGLQKSAGDKMKKLLGYLTNNRLLAVLVGVVVTGIIQSSSATTVIVVGFVNAGIMQLTQAVGVIMGANIGTTVTAWIVSMNEWGSFFKPEFFAPLVIGICVFVILFTKDSRKKNISEIGVGFGLLFIGLSFMSGAISPYKDAEIFRQAFTVLGNSPILAIAAGAVITGIIQSSSASVGILQTLAMNGVVGWRAAIFITLGQNIGTCVTALLSGIGSNRTGKRAAVIHLLFNMLGAVIFGVGMYVFFILNKELALSPINSVEISIFHTIFNLVNTIVLFPFANQLVRLSGVIVKESKDEAVQEDQSEITLRHLDNRILESPSFAVENAILEVVHMAEVTLENLKLSAEAIKSDSKEKYEKVFESEKVINKLESIITEYLIKIGNLPLSEKQHRIINNLFYTVSDIERIGDHTENLAEIAQEKIRTNTVFSDKAKGELEDILDLVYDSFYYAVQARNSNHSEYVRKVAHYEELVDSMEKELRAKHIKRLSDGSCQPTAGILFLDMISNLERISDHALNIASYISNEK